MPGVCKGLPGAERGLGHFQEIAAIRQDTYGSPRSVCRVPADSNTAHTPWAPRVRIRAPGIDGETSVTIILISVTMILIATRQIDSISLSCDLASG